MTKRVMIVDDQVDVAVVLGRLIEKCGCETHVCNDGPAALQAADHWKPDVVLLDLGLPTMDGYEVARRLRGSPHLSKVTIVALSGNEASEEQSNGAFDRHLLKPVGIQTLRQLLVD